MLRRFTLAGALTPQRADQALEDLAELPVARLEHGPFMRRAFALHRNVTFYDALYLATAELLNAELITADAALRRIPGSKARVRVLRGR